ncbi:FkbM family methyltransferase [Saccharothrix australiensis]|uniref:FkbM family methyltransferase n=1 Tax=Saccharothrix australiensis TaxID=2072 RepID=A0A495VWQ4_9PSEU|nr:FkbM family methyltransferase [Saccharothrix australiensis]RKT53841.1 FkbM family methyltransferase [Saccharothrix australiensis]
MSAVDSPRAPYLSTLPERFFRYLLFRSGLPYPVVRRLAPILVGKRRRERRIHDFRMALSPQDILQTRLLLDGVWEPVLTRWWAFLSARSSVVFDVGAHCGYYTLFGHSANPELEVHAFEPNAELCADVSANLALNGIDARVHLNQVAVGGSTGTTRLYVRDIEPAAASLNELDVYDRTIPVRSTSLDAYCDQHGVDRVDLCKFDIEGAELDAVQGMLEGLRAHRYRCLVLEVHALFMPEGGPRRMLSTFRQHGYTVRRIGEDGARPLAERDLDFDFDQWLVLSPEAEEELAEFRAGDLIRVPPRFAAIYEGVSWSPATIR